MTLRRRTLIQAAAAVPLAACARGEGPLRFWAMGREGEVVTELLEDFHREQPNIAVQVEQLPWTAAHEKLLTAFAGNALPDMAQLGNTWVAELGALDALAPLDGFVAAAPGASIDSSDYFDGIWRTNVVGGHLLGLPWYVDTRLLFYRRDLLAKVGFNAPPRDWAEWTAQMQRLSRTGVVPQPLILPSNEFEPLLALALQQGDPLLKDGDTRGNFSGPGFRRALGFYLDLLGHGMAPLESNQQIANVWQEFAKGTFAYYISGPWNIGEFDRRLPPELKKAWSTAPLPGPNGLGASTAGGSSLVILKHSRRKADAFKLIEFLSRPDVQARFYKLTGDLPPRKSAWAAIDADERTRAFATQLENVRPTPPVPEWERIANEMQLYAARAAAERQSVDTAVAALDAQVDRILAKRRWLHERGRA